MITIPAAALALCATLFAPHGHRYGHKHHAPTPKLVATCHVSVGLDGTVQRTTRFVPAGSFIGRDTWGACKR